MSSPYGFDASGAPIEAEVRVIALARKLVSERGAVAAAAELAARGLKSRRKVPFGVHAVALMAVAYNGRLLPRVSAD